MKIKLAAFSSMLLFATTSLELAAAPTVAKVEMPNPLLGETKVVVTGSDFGSFGGTIVSWDDFESHSVGVNIAGKSPIAGHVWSTLYGYSGKGIVVDRTRRVSGENSIKVEWGIDSNTIRAFGWAGKGPYDELYITYWRYMEGNFKYSTDNHKQFYLYGTADGFPQLMPLIPGGTQTWGVYNNVGDGNVEYNARNNINTLGWNWSNTSNKFQRWEIYTKLNSPYTQSNGIVRLWVDGRLGVNNEKYRVRYVDGKFNDFRLGHMAQGFPDTAKAWFDDIYIATTQARVEICNSNVYLQCSIKHLQFVDDKDWSSQKITFTPRNLAMLKGEKVYLYVVDRNGVVSNAFAMPRPQLDI